MIETIVLLQNGRYPFGEVTTVKKAIKVEDIRVYKNKTQLKSNKQKIQGVFAVSDHYSQSTAVSYQQNVNIIRLLKIYQEDLFLHFLFEYVPHSLKQYIQNRLFEDSEAENSQIKEMNSKLFLKKLCYQLGIIINFLVKRHIRMDIDFSKFGIDNDENLKLFIDPNCEVIPFSKVGMDGSGGFLAAQKIEADLRQFYQWKVEEILSRVNIEFRKLKRKDHYVPNFVIQGNNLLFCQESKKMSQTVSSCVNIKSQYDLTDQKKNVNNEQQQRHVQMNKLRGSQGNILGKMKTFECPNKEKQKEVKKSNRQKIQDNIAKLQHLRKKSKKINENVYQNYLSNSLQGVAAQFGRQSKSFNNNIATDSKPFAKKQAQDTKSWRNSDMSEKIRQANMKKKRESLPTHQPIRTAANRFKSKLNGKRSKSTRSHKGSFQFNPKFKQTEYNNHNRSFQEGQDEEFGDKSFNQTTKSIRIELQQTSRNNKERKNSYKVKILTCQEMEMDGQNVQQFVFNAMNKNFDHEDEDPASGESFDPQDIPRRTNSQERDEFRFRNKGSQHRNIPRKDHSKHRDRDNDEESCQSRYSRNSNKCSTQNSAFAQKFRSVGNQADAVPNIKLSEQPAKEKQTQKKDRKSSSQQKNIYEKYYAQFGKNEQDAPKKVKNQELQEKIRLAKEKAENVLNKYMKNKKMNANNSKIGH